MPDRSQPSDAEFLRNPVTLTGFFAGLGLSLVFVVWIYLANRVPALETFALERNAIAAACLGLIALFPVFKFRRSPKLLLFSSLIAWAIFTLTYRLLCAIFWALSDWRTTFQIFMEGVIVYLIVATACWLATLLARVRAAEPSGHQAHAHAPHPTNHAN